MDEFFEVPISRRGATTQRKACAMPTSVPAVLAAWLQPFAASFTPAVWRHVLIQVAGVVLAPGRRTVTATLRVMGLDQEAGFAVYHRVLSLGRWSSRAVAHRLLLLLVAAFVPTGPGVVGLDDTIERRWGAKIKARGIYRDPVRSRHGHFVTASRLRRLCVMLLAPVPWAGCGWALPFLSVLAPSERYATERGHRHKKLTDWARRLGPPSLAPDRALAARTARDRGGGQQLFRDRTLARCGAAPVHDLTAAARRRSV